MPQVEKKPPIKESVGAMYIAVGTVGEDGEFTGSYETEIVKLKTVKSVTVTENGEPREVYASGELYDVDSEVSSEDISIETIAFPDALLHKLRGETVEENGLVLTGGPQTRPFFAFGKVVTFKGGKKRMDWYPKCKLVENTDEATTREERTSEMTDTLTVKAFKFNDNGNVACRTTQDATISEEDFFGKVIKGASDLTK